MFNVDMFKCRVIYDVDDCLLNKLIELDKTVYSESDIGDFDLCKQYLSVNSDIYTVLMLDQKVIGYICFYPLKPETYSNYKMGKVNDSELTKEDILNFNDNFEFLLSSIVIDEEFRDTCALYILLHGFKEKLKDLNIFKGHILFDCVSDDGKKFCKRYFKSKLIFSDKGKRIFEGSIEDFMEDNFIAVTQKAGCYLINLESKSVAVVYRDYLDDWSFPKGHLENNESLADCAIRETAEETKRIAKIVDEIDPIIETYMTPRGEMCECIMFVAIDGGKSDNTSTDTHPTFWIDFDEVEEKLSYESLKLNWRHARKKIKEIFGI